MLDINFIRENKEVVAAGAKKKHIDVSVDDLLALDDTRRDLTSKVEAMRAKQNEVSDKITTASAEERDRMIAEMRTLKETLSKQEDELKGIIERWRELMLQVPNVPDVSVPDGESDADNQEVKVWGEKRVFDFEPKSHNELLVANGMVDLERGSKVAGFRGYFLVGDGARLLWALERFVIDRFMARKDFIPLIAPSLVKREPFMGTGYLPQSEEDLYKTQDGEYLAGTAEVGTMGYYMNETLDKASLPVKFFAFSPCFRREAGSYGKDTKGIFRVHEFYKFEQVVLCEANHEETVRHHEELTANSEGLLQELGLPYHVVINCGGDIGLGQVKKYDIEAWMPSEKTYRETHSSSYFHDFQTRRLNIRYKDAEGTMRFAHSLNNTALAMPRILGHIVENYQQADGSILIPEALRPYMQGRDRITKAG
jgi:seryl-tRNA synthetase